MYETLNHQDLFVLFVRDYCEYIFFFLYYVCNLLNYKNLERKEKKIKLSCIGFLLIIGVYEKLNIFFLSPRRT